MSKDGPKHKYVYMITDAIFTLADKKGATRDAIWKYLEGKKLYHTSIGGGKKMFLTQLKRLSRDNEFFSKSESNQQRYKLSAKFKGKLANLVNKGQEVHTGIKSAMTTKVKGTKKPQKKIKKVKMTKTKKGKAKLTKKQEKKNKATKIRKTTKKPAAKAGAKPAAKAGAKTQKKPAPRPSSKAAQNRGRSSSKSPKPAGSKKSVSPKPGKAKKSVSPNKKAKGKA